MEKTETGLFDDGKGILTLDSHVERDHAAAAAAFPKTKLEVVDPTVIRVDEDMLRARRVYVFGEIEQDSAGDIVQRLHWLDERSRGKVTVYISSIGGDVYWTMGIFDTIRAMTSPTVTVGIGEIASGASILLQAGQVRCMAPRAWLMIHEVTHVRGEASTTSMTEDDLALLKRLQQQMLDIYTERSKVRREEIDKQWKRKDWWLTAAEALKQGFIDEVAAEARPKKSRRAPRKR